MKDLVKRFSQAAVLVLSAVIIAEMLAGEWGRLASYMSGMRALPLLGGLLVLWMGRLVGMYTWRMVMRSMGYGVPLLRSLYLVSMFQAASYIPGGFWHFAGIAYWAEEDEIPKKVTAVGTGINSGANVIVALLLFFAVAPFYLSEGALLTYLPLALAVPAGLLAVHPRVFYPMLNRGLSYLGREAVEPALEYADLLKVFGVKLVSRVLTGLALYLVLLSVHPFSLSIVPALVALYAGAWAVGFLILFMPGGLGVREVTAISFLSSVMAEPLAGLLVLVFRALSLASEFLFAAFFWTVTGQMSRPSASSP